MDSAQAADLLDCAVHAVLWRRKVYPRESFVREVRFGAAVWRSKHAGLCSYVRKYCERAAEWWVQGHLEMVCVALFEAGRREPRERFNFSFRGGAAPGAQALERFQRSLLARLLGKEFGPDLRGAPTFTLFVACRDLDRTSFEDDWLEESRAAASVEPRAAPSEREPLGPPSERTVLDSIACVPLGGDQELEAWYEASLPAAEAAAAAEHEGGTMLADAGGTACTGSPHAAEEGTTEDEDGAEGANEECTGSRDGGF